MNVVDISTNQQTIDDLKRELKDCKSEHIIPVCIDFDGTVVEHMYPVVGNTLPMCVEYLKFWVESFNVGLILDTMRDGKELEDAVNWFKKHDIPLYGISKHPTQHTWTKSPKAYAPFSIDDRNVGTPLKIYSQSRRLGVDWDVVGPFFTKTLKAITK